MTYFSQVKSIGYLKAKATDILSDLEKRREPLIITQHGEAKAASRTWLPTRRCTRKETQVLLKILALGNHEVEEGRVRPLKEVVERIRAGEG